MTLDRRGEAATSDAAFEIITGRGSRVAANSTVHPDDAVDEGPRVFYNNEL